MRWLLWRCKNSETPQSATFNVAVSKWFHTSNYNLVVSCTKLTSKANTKLEGHWNLNLPDMNQWEYDINLLYSENPQKSFCLKHNIAKNHNYISSSHHWNLLDESNHASVCFQQWISVYLYDNLLGTVTKCPSPIARQLLSACKAWCQHGSGDDLLKCKASVRTRKTEHWSDFVVVVNVVKVVAGVGSQTCWSAGICLHWHKQLQRYIQWAASV